MMTEIRPHVAGIYFIPAFKRYDVIADLVASLDA